MSTRSTDHAVSALPPHKRSALEAEMTPGERVLLVTKPLARHAWGDGEVSMAQSLLARALLGAVRVGLAGWIALNVLALLVSAPVLIIHDSGFTLGALLMVVISVAILGVMFAMVAYVASAPLLWMWLASRLTIIVTSAALYAIRDHRDRAIARRTPLPAPPEIAVRRVRANGVGDVVLGRGAVYLPPGDGTDGEVAEYDVGLLSIPEAERVAALVIDAARALHEPLRVAG